MMQSLKFMTLLIAFLVCHSLCAAEPQHRDLEYGRVGERSLRLDLYQPPTVPDSGAPTVVWVHGGAWRAGSKADVPVSRWLSDGFAIASVDYRLSPEAPFPAQVHDIKAAIRFLRAQAGQYGLDPKRFVVAGSSAGGHLAALVGVSGHVNELEGEIGDFDSTDSSVQAIVSFYGASNLASILSQSTPHGLSVRVPALQLLLGGQPNEKPDLATLASPVAHVDRADPPLWLIHGDADPQMPIEQSYELSEKYKTQSLPVSFEVIAGGKHGGKEFYEPQRLDRIAGQLKESL